MNSAPILAVKRLRKHYPVKSGIFSRVQDYIYAVDDISFQVQMGETFGLVGESGSGKTTVGKCVIRLIEPTGGDVLFRGKDVTHLDDEELRGLRREMQIVFQDPYASLDPRMSVLEAVGEPFVVHGVAERKDLRKRVTELVSRVGLSLEDVDKYPHEFSGGQRQRIVIARALALRPSLVVLDEPTSALDVSIQSQILNMLKELQEEMALTYLFISHNLSVVRHMSGRMGVMYLGKLVELAETKTLFARPLHPYTQALLASIPRPNPKARKDSRPLGGDVPSAMKPPPGCRFHPRCPIAVERCAREEPEFREVEKGHWVACHLA